MSKENNLFVLLFSRENSVFHTNQPTLSINLFCCGEYSEIERRKIAQNKFHASACEIFNVTVLTQLTAIALAAQFETALFLKTTKTLSQLVPLEQASPHSKDNLCFSKLAKLRRSSPNHSSNCAAFRSFCDVSHMTQLVPPACRGRGAPGQAPHSRDKTNSLMNCHHHNHQHLAQVLHTPSKERGSKQYFRSEYFGLCEASILNVFSFSGF